MTFIFSPWSRLLENKNKKVFGEIIAAFLFYISVFFSRQSNRINEYFLK